MALKVQIIPVLQDNYIFLLRDEASGKSAVVDPAEAQPVLDQLASFSADRLDYILNTHHHLDHVGGNKGLQEQTGCIVVGPSCDAARIPGIKMQVAEGELVSVGESQAQVLFVPGHTRGHIAFWFAQDGALFIGDTLFAAGCGRLFEGTPAQMWASLQKLKKLPPATMIYCAHEYTLANLKFALHLEPESSKLLERQRKVLELRGRGLPSIPTTLAEELATNPFLRADDPQLKKALTMEQVADEQFFAHLRKLKDHFGG